MDYKHQSSLTSYKESKLPTSQQLIRSGNVELREQGTFSGTSWKPKRLELDSKTLTIVNLSSTKTTRIQLRDITELERTDLTDHSLCLKAKKKQYNFSFASDPELYDWQEDIYQRCPLGGYSAPFDFVHKSHIGSDNITGDFEETKILPIYSEIIGGIPPSNKSTPAIYVAPRSRPVSNVPLGLTLKTPSSQSSLLEGPFVIKHSGLFAGWLWKERYLTLTPQALIIHRRNNKVSAASKTIPLPSLTRVEPDEKRDGCLVVEFATRPTSSAAAAPTNTVSILFQGYSDLYTWRDALYQHSSMASSVGIPTNFVHKTHVGFDPTSGVFTGLPSDWQSMNPSSSTSAEKKARRQSRRKSVPLAPPVTA